MIVIGEHESILVDHIQDRNKRFPEMRPCILEMSAQTVPFPVVGPGDLLDDALDSLHRLKDLCINKPDVSSAVSSLITFVQDYKSSGPHPPASPSSQYLLQPLVDLLFWIPTKFIHRVHLEPQVMLLTAHLHALPLIIDPITTPESAYFRSVNVGPIVSFYEELTTIKAMSPPDQRKNYDRIFEMLEFPLMAVSKFSSLVKGIKEALRVDTRMSEKYYLRNGEEGAEEDNYEKEEEEEDEEVKCTSTTVQILESYPVGLWYKSMDEGCCYRKKH